MSHRYSLKFLWKRLHLLRSKRCIIVAKNMNELFNYCTRKTNFMFSNKNSDQKNGVRKGSQLTTISILENHIQYQEENQAEVCYPHMDNIFQMMHDNQKDFNFFSNLWTRLNRLSFLLSKSNTITNCLPLKSWYGDRLLITNASKDSNHIEKRFLYMPYYDT